MDIKKLVALIIQCHDCRCKGGYRSIINLRYCLQFESVQ